MPKRLFSKILSPTIQLGVILVMLFWSHNYSYPLFHSLAEIFCVVIAVGIFAIVWNSRGFIDNNYFLFMGVSLLFVGMIDLLHTLSYRGISIFDFGGNNLPTQLWLIGRYLEAGSLVLATFFIGKKLRPLPLFFVFFALTSLSLASVFFWKNFPASYVDGSGLTLFKIASEYVIIGLFALSIYLLYRQKKQFETRVLAILVLAVILKIFAEFMFTLYVSVFALSNFIGHMLKISSFYLFYLGIIETAMMRPYQLLFKNLKDSEASIKESEQRYRSLIEYSPSAIFLHLHGAITYVNPAGLKLFGAERAEQIIGKNLIDFIDAPYRDFMDSRLESVYLGSKFIPLAEIKINALNGQKIEVETTESLINLQGKLAGQTVMNNITQRKKIEKELADRTAKIEGFANDLKKFKLAVDHASDQVIITDPEMKIIYANPAAEKITGYSRAEIIGRTPSLWRDLEKNSIQENRIQGYCRRSGFNAIDGNNFTCEINNRRRDGSAYIAMLDISPVMDEAGRVLFFVMMERDVTKLKEIDRAKTEFVSLASHQLRTPLSSIALSAELLLRGVGGQVEERQLRYLKEIYNSTERMKDLIEALLNISRIELGTFMVKLENINLPVSVDGILKEMEMQMKLKGLKFEKKYEPDLPEIKFDKNILNMVVDNLMSNAIRYTPSGGRIVLALERKSGEIVISVADTGCGIPLNQQGKIFEKLFRADNAKEISTEGAGLGLYTAQSALKKAGGRVWFESEPGKGAIFHASLPL